MNDPHGTIEIARRPESSLMRTEVNPYSLPKVPPWRRAAAFAIDLFAVGVLNSILGGNWFSQALSFLILWLAIRVVAVNVNRGQSLGRWALDMKIIDARFARLPGLTELSKREAIAGLAGLLALTGFRALTTRNAFYLLLFLPLAADFGVIFAEPVEQQAFHDRLGQTLIVATRRGFSLDLKLKKWVAIVRARVQQ